MPREVEIAFGVVSVVLFVATVVGVPWLLVRLPPDYFVRAPARAPLAFRLLRNVAGLVLVGLGVAMLVLPGQGVVTLLLGIALLDLPVKRRLIGRILGRPHVHRAIDAMRARAGRPPLVLPSADAA
jgi:hypothetical protein